MVIGCCICLVLHPMLCGGVGEENCQHPPPPAPGRKVLDRNIYTYLKLKSSIISKLLRKQQMSFIRNDEQGHVDRMRVFYVHRDSVIVLGLHYAIYLYSIKTRHTHLLPHLRGNDKREMA